MKKETVHVFKTDVHTTEQYQALNVLNDREGIRDWSIDLEDCDNVLRVVGSGITPGNIIRIMDQLGFCCEELASGIICNDVVRRSNG